MKKLLTVLACASLFALLLAPAALAGSVDNSVFWGTYAAVPFPDNSNTASSFQVELGNDQSRQFEGGYLYLRKDQQSYTWTASQGSTQYTFTVHVSGNTVRYGYLKSGEGAATLSELVSMSLAFSEDYATMTTQGLEWSSDGSVNHPFISRVFKRVSDSKSSMEWAR